MWRRGRRARRGAFLIKQQGIFYKKGIFRQAKMKIVPKTAEGPCCFRKCLIFSLGILDLTCVVVFDSRKNCPLPNKPARHLRVWRREGDFKALSE
jgi:hypothetical protein